MNTPPPPRCATCAYYTPVTLSNGLCQPPTERGGEPFAIQCRKNDNHPGK